MFQLGQGHHKGQHLTIFKLADNLTIHLCDLHERHLICMATPLGQAQGILSQEYDHPSADQQLSTTLFVLGDPPQLLHKDMVHYTDYRCTALVVSASSSIQTHADTNS